MTVNIPPVEKGANTQLSLAGTWAGFPSEAHFCLEHLLSLAFLFGQGFLRTQGEMHGDLQQIANGYIEKEKQTNKLLCSAVSDFMNK